MIDCRIDFTNYHRTKLQQILLKFYSNASNEKLQKLFKQIMSQ